METTEIKHTEELQKLTNAFLTKLEPDKRKKDLYKVSFAVYDYSHLMFIISDLMKLCVNSIEDGFDSDTAILSKINVAQILEIAIQLLPIDEAEFLDRSRELLLKESSNDATENQNS